MDRKLKVAQLAKVSIPVGHSLLNPIIDTVDSLLAWFSSSLGQVASAYCDLETADSRHTLVNHDGSLLSIIRIHGCTKLVGPQEFENIHNGLTRALSPALGRTGYAVQFYFYYDREAVRQEISDILIPAQESARKLGLQLDDLFQERIAHLSEYCATESCYMVFWTRPQSLTEYQIKESGNVKLQKIRANKLPPMLQAQNFIAAIPELRENHDSMVRGILNDLQDLSIYAVLLDAHTALYEVRKSVDPDVTQTNWQPVLPGDKIPLRELKKNYKHDISEIMWPSLAHQMIPRDAEILDLRTARVGDKIYSSAFIELFPQEIQPFFELFRKTLHIRIPWRMSFLIESDGLKTLGLRPLLASILSFASRENSLISDAADLLKDLKSQTDEAIVKLRVSAATWAQVGEEALLRSRAAEFTKALQGWGQCQVGEVSGDAFGGALSSTLALNLNSVATASVAPLSDVVYMLPFNRPASPWGVGAALFRSPDGKVWPYQPGSTQQTTWIDLIYARPGSGKSVLSNSINLALCLQAGLKRLPRISIIDIGPSSSGLISLLQEALPDDKKHLVAYHRLRMTPKYTINPFDTQLGSRFPTPQDRSFLVNFITLLATPIGEQKPYDGIPDMAGLVVDELYKNLHDSASPHRYTKDMDPAIDTALAQTGLITDSQTSWWEVTDALFSKGFIHEATLAQRYASPLMADAVAICRSQVVEDLYGKIIAPTGEPLINAFGRMISSAVREYPTLSRITAFDLGEARVISLDLDEVAKTGGEAADRQTAVMYMLGRYILGRNFYLTEDIIEDFPEMYRDFHRARILEIREDQKRLVMDEFHRTSRAQAVRDQVLVDMREGRKWKVQVALLSQSLEDFDPVMIEFATSIFIMDAGPKQAVDKSVATFGLSETARLALTTRVHGPRAEGATFLAQFSTKFGINVQLCTTTLGPIELWAFNTTAEDTRIRNELYKKIGAAETRSLLAMLYPTGSAAKVIEQRLEQKRGNNKETHAGDSLSVIEEIIEEILSVYRSMPNHKLV